ncbi:MAG: formate C-acetyltransferase [Sphingomonadales bacterium]|nr:formate C-acetyltransferase [Sphingomonadales bacterium]
MISTSSQSLQKQSTFATADEMSPRIRRLKERLYVDRYPLSIEKSRWQTQAYKASDGEPQIIRRAKSLACVLDNIPIFIEDDELIVGQGSAKPMGLELDFYAGLWPRDEIEGLREAGYDISPQEEAEILDMNAYWQKFNPLSRLGEDASEEMWGFLKSGMVLPPWKSRTDGPGGGYAESGLGLGPGFYLMTVDFELALQKGLLALIDDAEQRLAAIEYAEKDALERAHFLKATIISLRAIIGFAERYADLAQTKAAAEADPARRAELEAIAQICRRVPAHPARTFREAMQSFWFTFLMITPSPTASMGRFDQFMNPYYEADLANGRLSEEEALELLQCLRIKDMQLNRTSGKAARQKNAGMAKWHNMVIGGVTKSGEDATNPLTYLILEAVRRLPTAHHTVTLRVHDGTPEPLMKKALEVVKMGTGMPAFIGDRSYIAYLLDQGVPLEEARNYAIGGCLDVTLPGKSRTAAVGMFIVSMVLEATLLNGVVRRTGDAVGLSTGKFEDFKTFDDFYAAFKAQLRHFLKLHADKNNAELLISRELFPDPVRSVLMDGGLAEGKALLERTYLLENGALLNMVGMINVVDSLTAVKKLVFEDRVVSQAELIQALDANWQGREDLRRRFLEAPKYGNGDDYADQIAVDLFDYWADVAASLRSCLGGAHKPTGISVSSQWPGGAQTGATPDGRFSGECLADGTMSAMRGRDLKGPTGLMNSAMKISQNRYQAALFNIKFHPSAMQSDEDLRKISFLIRTYFARGGKHVQFNVVSREILLEAQKHPEQYRDLLVRVAGYSAYFIQLGKAMQDEIIGRTAHIGAG